jgi:hypothetical protein
VIRRLARATGGLVRNATDARWVVLALALAGRASEASPQEPELPPPDEPAAAAPAAGPTPGAPTISLATAVRTALAQGFALLDSRDAVSATRWREKAAVADFFPAVTPTYARGDGRDVFGVDLTVLKGMADVSTSDTVKGVTAPLPDSSLVVVTGDISFDAVRPLKGTAVVVVKGNVTINPGSNSFFSGLLYVDGNLTIRAPALIRGCVIARGTVDIRGTGGDYVEIESDPGIITRLMTLMGQYRYSKAAYEPALKRSDGRPTETRAR